MKRLLLIPALVLPTWLVSCNGHKTPTPAEVVKEAHEAINERPTILLTPTPPDVKPTWAHRPAPKKHAVKRKPAPAPKKAESPLPPQQGPICIFPFNLIPNCYPAPNF